jgi:predicted RNA binding protein YcfA (HicA-like mRNA interferase family)
MSLQWFIKVRDIIKAIEADGWRMVAQKGSHRQFKHPTKSGRVTVPGHPSDDLHPGLEKSIRQQAQIKKEN